MKKSTLDLDKMPYRGMNALFRLSSRSLVARLHGLTGRTLDHRFIAPCFKLMVGLCEKCKSFYTHHLPSQSDHLAYLVQKGWFKTEENI